MKPDKDLPLYPLLDRAVEYYEFHSLMRRYHDVEHARNVVQGVHRMTNNDPSIELVLAAMWHDAIYFPGVGGGINELASAAALGNEARLMDRMSPLSKEHKLAVNMAQELIERTTIAWHMRADFEGPVTGDTAILLDSDLGSLADNWQQFLGNQKNIIIENNGDVSNDTAWIQCAKFLRQLMNTRKFIYHTAWARDHWEDLARRNIRMLCDNCGLDYKEQK